MSMDCIEKAAFQPRRFRSSMATLIWSTARSVSAFTCETCDAASRLMSDCTALAASAACLAAMASLKIRPSTSASTCTHRFTRKASRTALKQTFVWQWAQACESPNCPNLPLRTEASSSLSTCRALPSTARPRSSSTPRPMM